MREKIQNGINWLHHRRVAVAWVVLGIAIAAAISISATHFAKQAAVTNYNSQIRSCLSSNFTRRETNNNVAASINTQKTVRAFLLDATAARAASPKPTDQATAKRYVALYELEGKIVYDYLPLRNCYREIPRP